MNTLIFTVALTLGNLLAVEPDCHWVAKNDCEGCSIYWVEVCDFED